MGAGTNIAGEEADMEGLSVRRGEICMEGFRFSYSERGSVVYGRENKGGRLYIGAGGDFFAINKGKQAPNISSQTLPS